MPYIKTEYRKAINPAIADLIVEIQNFPIDEREGILNYTFAKILCNTMRPEEGWRYKSLNRVKGILGCCWSEIYRRIGFKLEDAAIEKNGDLEEFINL